MAAVQADLAPRLVLRLCDFVAHTALDAGERPLLSLIEHLHQAPASGLGIRPWHQALASGLCAKLPLQTTTAGRFGA
jgi:hypothetical protein